MYMINIEQFTNIFTNPEINIKGDIKHGDEKKSIEFMLQDLSCEKSISLYSKLGQSLDDALSDFYSTKEKKSDNITNSIKSLKEKGLSNEDVAKELNNKGEGLDISILFKIVFSVMKNDDLMRFLTNDIIKNYILIKIGSGSPVKIDNVIHNFDKPDYKKFLSKLWIQIIVKEMIVFTGGHQS